MAPQAQQAAKETENAAKGPKPVKAEEREVAAPEAIGGLLQRATSAPDSLTPADGARLQRTVGNRAVERLATTRTDAPAAKSAPPSGGILIRRSLDRIVARATASPPIVQTKPVVNPQEETVEQDIGNGAERVVVSMAAAPTPPPSDGQTAGDSGSRPYPATSTLAQRTLRGPVARATTAPLAVQAKPTAEPVEETVEQETGDATGRALSMASAPAPPPGDGQNGDGATQLPGATLQRQVDEEEEDELHLSRDPHLQRQVDEEEEDELRLSRDPHLQRQVDDEEEDELHLSRDARVQRQVEDEEEEELHLSRDPHLQRQVDDEEEDELHLSRDSRLQRQVEDEEEDELHLSRDTHLQRQVDAEEEDELHLSRDTHIQRQVEDEEEDELRLSSASGDRYAAGGSVDHDVESSIRRSKGSGRSLPDSLRSSMEQGFGADFGRVRVHTGPQADNLNRSLNARAFTTGRDIFFKRNEYNPVSSGGQRLLAHELTHVVQQGSAGARRTEDNPSPVANVARHSLQAMVARLALAEPSVQPKLTVGPAGDRYEQEADRMAAMVMRQIAAPTPSRLQRRPEEGESNASPLLDRVGVGRMDDSEFASLSIAQRSLHALVTSRALTSTVVQTKLTVGPVNDRYAVGRAVDRDEESSIHWAKDVGRSSPDTVRLSTEQNFSAERDIFVKKGEYSPVNSGGKKLLALVPTHVVQQRGVSLQRVNGKSPTGSPTGTKLADQTRHRILNRFDGNVLRRQTEGTPLIVPGRGAIAISQVADHNIQRSIDDWLTSSPNIDGWTYTQIRDDISEIESWMSRQIESSPDYVRLEEALGLLRQKLTEKAGAAMASPDKGKRRRGRKGRHKRGKAAPAQSSDQSQMQKPRILVERTSIPYDDPVELRNEIDRIMTWLARKDVTPDDREILQGELQNLAPSLEKDVNEEAGKRHARKVQQALTPKLRKTQNPLVETMKLVDSIQPLPSNPMEFSYIMHEGERIVISAQDHINMRERILKMMEDSKKKIEQTRDSAFEKWAHQAKIDADEGFASFVVSKIRGEDAHDVYDKMEFRFRAMEKNLSDFRRAKKTNSLTAIARALTQAEVNVLMGKAVVDRWVDGIITTTDKIITGLTITRDLSFSIVTTFFSGAGFASMVKSGMTLANVAKAGLTVTTVATASNAAMRGGTNLIGQAAVGDVDYGTVLKETTEGAKRGFVDSATGIVTAGTGGALGQGKTVGGRVLRGAATDVAGGVTSGTLDAAFAGKSPGEILESGLWGGIGGGLSGATGSLVGPAVKGKPDLVKFLAVGGSEAAVSTGVELGRGKSLEDAVRTGAISLGTSGFMATAKVPGFKGRGKSFSSDVGSPPPQKLLTAGSPPPKQLTSGPPEPLALPSGPPPQKLLTAGSPPPKQLTSGPPEPLALPSGPPPQKLLTAGSPPPKQLTSGPPEPLALPSGPPPQKLLTAGSPPPKQLTSGPPPPKQVTSSKTPKPSNAHETTDAKSGKPSESVKQSAPEAAKTPKKRLSAGDQLEKNVKDKFRSKIIKENEILRDENGKVTGEIDFETAEAVVEVGKSLGDKLPQLHKLAEVAQQRGKRLDVIYGPDTPAGRLNAFRESMRKKWGNRVRFIPHHD